MKSDSTPRINVANLLLTNMYIFKQNLKLIVEAARLLTSRCDLERNQRPEQNSGTHRQASRNQFWKTSNCYRRTRKSFFGRPSGDVSDRIDLFFPRGGPRPHRACRAYYPGPRRSQNLSYGNESAEKQPARCKFCDLSAYDWKSESVLLACRFVWS